MLYWALVFLVIALVAALFGFGVLPWPRQVSRSYSFSSS